MAIDSILYGFNPMDIVKGYEYGIERGQTREKNDEQIRRERLANQILELQNLPAARLSGMETEAKIGALESLPGMRQEQRRKELTIDYGKSLRNQMEEQSRERTVDERLREQEARYTPERVDVRIGGEATAEKARAGQAGFAAGSYEALQAQQRATTEAQQLLQAGETAEREALRADPSAARADPWERADRAIDQATAPETKALLQRQRDQHALRALTGAAKAGDADTMNLYLERYGRNLMVERVEGVDKATGQKIVAWQLFKVDQTTDANGQPVMNKVPIENGFLSVDANNRNWIGYQLPGLLGIAEPAPARGQPRATTPRVPAAPRAPAPARPAKEVPKTPAEGVGTAIGRPAPSAVTPKQKQDLDEFNRRQKKLMNISDAYDKLTADEQVAIERLSKQATELAKLIEQPGGNTTVNQTMHENLRRQIAALIPTPQETQQPITAA